MAWPEFVARALWEALDGDLELLEQFICNNGAIASQSDRARQRVSHAIQHETPPSSHDLQSDHAGSKPLPDTESPESETSDVSTLGINVEQTALDTAPPAAITTAPPQETISERELDTVQTTALQSAEVTQTSETGWQTEVNLLISLMEEDPQRQMRIKRRCRD